MSACNCCSSEKTWLSFVQPEELFESNMTLFLQDLASFAFCVCHRVLSQVGDDMAELSQPSFPPIPSPCRAHCRSQWSPSQKCICLPAAAWLSPPDPWTAAQLSFCLIIWNTNQQIRDTKYFYVSILHIKKARRQNTRTEIFFFAV